MNTFNLTLDLNKSRASSAVRLRQGDKSGTTIMALILDHGATANLTGMTAQLVMELPDGTQYYRKSASVSGNVVTVVVDESTAASVTGRTANAYFQLLQGTTVKASTGSFAVEILPDALADAEVAESYDSAIQDAIDALDAAVADMPETVEDVLEAHPEWTTTVQDGSITKAKLGTDLARDRERLLYRLDNMLTAQLPEGDVATATDAAKTPVAGLALYGRSTQAGTPTPSAPVPIVSVEPDSDGGVKLVAAGRNLLPKVATVTSNGVTFTVNDDGSVTCDGTSTGSARINFTTHASGTSAKLAAALTAGTAFALSTGVTMPTGTKLEMAYYKDRAYTGTAQAVGANSSQRALTAPSIDYDEINTYIQVASGTTVSNLVVWPQLELGSAATAYQPYEQTVTPIPLDGHELRSLPGGTRDEVRVDERGHAVLVQRVGSVTYDGSESWTTATVSGTQVYRLNNQASRTGWDTTASGQRQRLCNRLTVVTNDAALASTAGTYRSLTHLSVNWDGANNDLAAFKAALAATPLEIVYLLATPRTIDLGTIDPVPLCGPDLTAQVVPSAPMQLTYERDLNATLARLESAIAELATN